MEPSTSTLTSTSTTTTTRPSSSSPPSSVPAPTPTPTTNPTTTTSSSQPDVVRRQAAEILAQAEVISRLRDEVKRLKEQRARCQCFKPSAVASMQLTGQAADLLSFLPASPSTPVHLSRPGAAAAAAAAGRAGAGVGAVPPPLSAPKPPPSTDKQVEALQRSLVEQGKELARMDAKLEAYKRHVQMMTSTRDDLPVAVTRAAGATGGDNCCRHKTTQIKRLQRLLEERTSLVDALKGSIEGSTKEIQALRASKRELEELRTSLLARSNSASSEMARLHREIHRLKEELANHGQRGLNPASGATGDVFVSPGSGSDGMTTPVSKTVPLSPADGHDGGGGGGGGLLSMLGWS